MITPDNDKILNRMGSLGFNNLALKYDLFFKKKNEEYVGSPGFTLLIIRPS